MTEPEDTCLSDGTSCHWSGKFGLCCSGNCVQDSADKYGKCELRIPYTFELSTVTSILPVIPTSKCSNCSNHPNIVVVIVAPSIIVLTLVITAGSFFLYWRKKKTNKQQTNAAIDSKEQSSNDSTDFMHKNIDSLPFDNKWEIAESDFSMDMKTQLGSGCFGLVTLGKVKGVTVAVKTARNHQVRSLLLEIKILQYIGPFDHIVSLVGCNTNKAERGSIFLFLEYCPFGCLESYLRNNKHNFIALKGPNSVYDGEEEILEGYQKHLLKTQYADLPDSKQITPGKLLRWSLQITSAMIFLASKKVIHADIATRNVLLLRHDHAKLTDFGLSRRLSEYNSYVKKNQEPLPWMWLALETLTEFSFSHKTDVWSLGIFLWEVYSLGEIPYPGQSWTPDFVSLLKGNVRPLKPVHAPEDLYTLMRECWREDPNTRPTFEEIYEQLDRLKYL